MLPRGHEETYNRSQGELWKHVTDRDFQACYRS